jgi:hypothetical protein
MQMRAWSHRYVLLGHLLKDGDGISCFLVIGLGLQIKNCSKYLESIHHSVIPISDLLFSFPAESCILAYAFKIFKFSDNLIVISLTILSSSPNSTIVPLFEKVLSASDAGRIGRLVLPKACAEVSFDI